MGLAESDGGKTPVAGGLLLLDDVCLDGDGQVIGLT
jgi:hypothetical protein